MGALDALIYGVRTILFGGSEMPQWSKLNFASGFVVADNEDEERTDVSVAVSGSNLSLSGETRGDLITRGASGWQRLAAGTSGYVLKSAGPGADLAYGEVTTLAGLSGVATISASQVRWGVTGRGTLSIEASTTTTTNSANQTLATIAIDPDTIVDIYVRLLADDIDNAGGYRGEWKDTFSRRTGVNSGNLERPSGVAAPSITDAKSWGNLTGASFDVSVSSNNLLVRGSPGTADDVKWNMEIVILVNA